MRKIKVAFYIGNGSVPSVDFSSPEKGNPGTGAAHYLHVAIPYYLQKYDENIGQAVILAQQISTMPNGVEAHEIESVSDAARLAKQLGVDYFVFRPRQTEEDNILSVIDELELPSIGRAALTPYPPHQRRMAASHYFKTLVCVGRVQYDQLCDTPLNKKITMIENGIFAGQFKNVDQVKKDEKLVVYLGALTPQKGFHLLAQAWPKVLSEIPDARLKVIGSARTYQEASPVGPLGVADASYESKCILPHLSQNGHALLPGVEFMGNLGADKAQILQTAAVGVANPSGATETSCVSAIEFQAAGTPVVSGAYFALLDTVRHGETGLLGRSVKDLQRNICKLLSDQNASQSMRTKAQAYARGRYDMSVIGPKWTDLFYKLEKNNISVYKCSSDHLMKHHKWLRILNKIMQDSIGKHIFWPSVSDIDWVARKIKKALTS